MSAKAYRLCDAQINLGAPVGREKVRAGWGVWRTVWLYDCPVCNSRRRIFCNSYRGKNPVPGVGAVVCGAYIGL